MSVSRAEGQPDSLQPPKLEAAARALLPNAAPRRSNAWVRVANDPSAYEHPLLVGDRHGTLEATHRQTAKEEMSRGDESGTARL